MKQKMLIVALATTSYIYAVEAVEIKIPTFEKREAYGPGVMVTEVPRYDCYGAYYDYIKNKFIVDNTQKVDCIEMQKLAIKKFNEDKKNANKK